MDTKFSAAVHILILISESSTPTTSEQMAASVGANASYIRKILALLKRAGIIDGRRGVSGHTLTAPPEKISLLAVYQAVTEQAEISLLDMHQNPSDRCIVGRHIRPVLADMFADAAQAFAHSLSSKTLADCIDNIRKRID